MKLFGLPLKILGLCLVLSLMQGLVFLPAPPAIQAHDSFQRTQPQVLWEKTYGGPGDDRGACSVFYEKDQSIITVGTTIEIGQFNSSVYIVKTDLSGSMIWERNYGSRSNNHAVSVLLNRLNEIIVCFNSMQVDQDAAEGNNVAMIKLDQAGNLLEEVLYDHVTHQYASKMISLKDGSFILTGSRYDASFEMYDVFIMKIDENLLFSWQKTMLSDHMVFAHDLIQVDQGYLLLSTMHIGQGLMRIMLQKTDNFGNILWDQTLGSKKNFMGSSLIQSSDGSYIVLGETDSYLDEVGIILYKILEDGRKLWEKFHIMEGNTLGKSIIETCNGGFLIAGATQISIEDMLYAAGQAKAYLLFTDSFGNKLWDKAFGGKRHDFLLDLMTLPDNSYLLTGRSSSFSRGDMDLYLIHLSAFVYDKPVITVYPENIYFGVLEKNTISQAQLVYISNEGWGNLNGYVVPDQQWIVTSDNTFIIPTFGFLALMISINTSEMSEGNYTGHITFQTNGGQKSIALFCDVIDNSPILRVDPSEINFGTAIDRQPLRAGLTVSNQGRKNLTGQIKSSDPWISVSPSSFFSNRFELEVTIHLSKLYNGKHQGQVLIQSNGGNYTVPIYFECQFQVMIVVLTIGKPTVRVNHDAMQIDPDNPEVVPVILNGRTLVPLRFLSELFGATVEWNPDEKTIFLDCPEKDITILLRVNHHEVWVNNSSFLLDIPPLILQNRVFVPLRFLAKSFGAEVSVDQSRPEEPMQIILRYER